MEVVILQMGLSIGLIWSCFCRLVRTDRDTERVVRWAIVCEAAAALWLATAPLLPLIRPSYFMWEPWTTPECVWIAFLASALGFHASFAKLWQPGSPALRELKRAFHHEASPH